MCAQKLRQDTKKAEGKLPFGNKTVNLLFIRTLLVQRNELFKKEREELERLKRSRSRSYKKKLAEHCKRWGVDERGDCYTPESGIDKPVEFHEDEFGKIQITVDMRYPLKMVLNLIEKELEEQFRRIRRDKRFHLLPPVNLRDGHIRSDIQNYLNWLKVWDLKMEKKHLSWGRIELEIPNCNKDTARNWYRHISKLIKKGLPGFTPFPQK